MKYKVAIRTVLSKRVGTGHFYRMKNLCEAMGRSDYKKIMFIDSPDNMKSNGESFNFCDELISFKDKKNDLVLMSNYAKRNGQFDCLVVDDYSLSSNWMTSARGVSKRIVLFDDLLNRKIDCDLIVNGNVNVLKKDYNGLTRSEAQLLLGPKYLVLARSFLRPRKLAVKKRYSFKQSIKTHVFFGGADISNHTERFSRLLLERFNNVSLIVVLSGHYEFDESIRSLHSLYGARIKILRNTNMAKSLLMVQVAVGAPGITTWERACLGVPALYCSTNLNQHKILLKLKSLGFCDYMGSADQVTDEQFVGFFRRFILKQAKLKSMRRKGLKTVDGQGARRVTARIKLLCRRADG
ncbi:MAG TPA: UDP-2,4-diacetamido-2,4,6-trideoxy-beta-L-altropyranose hydrolase [Candidatus Omnitrophota bacterium]|nr:UDP-2,4-diacetamido-2,4,6-trideoxy-beta-L-altropyranose hydrolase [Candidatus Omnitrophota bacterium]